MSPLALLKEGEKGEIVAHPNRFGCGREGRRRTAHLLSMGLRPGRKVEMVTNQGSGPLVLRLDEARIGLGRGMAMKIYVRRDKS
ncbi:MAG: FeoA family protein [Syntrophales bacterium]|nr:FeoA family protein [Syntrophales bacterium]